MLAPSLYFREERYTLSVLRLFYFWWFIPIQAAVFIMDDTAFGLQCAKYLFFLMTKHLTKRVIRHSFYRHININLLKTIWFNGLIFSWKCQVYWKIHELMPKTLWFLQNKHTTCTPVNPKKDQASLFVFKLK